MTRKQQERLRRQQGLKRKLGDVVPEEVKKGGIVIVIDAERLSKLRTEI